MKQNFAASLKKIFSLLFCFATISIYAQQKNTPDLDSRITALSNKAKAGNLTKKETKEFKDIGYQVQNNGFALDEKSHDYSNALVFINKALSIWELSGDTLNEANNRKYKGYLLGRLGQFPEGKKEIQQAIFLFQQKRKPAGVAVSYYDLSRVFEFQAAYDSSLYYANLALTYWKNNVDSSRIFIVRNQLINIYYHTKKYKEAGQVVQQNEMMLTQTKLHWQQLIDFYDVTIQFYKKWKKKEQLSRYTKLLQDKTDALSTEGITPRSSFEVVEK
jgi:tetratricopeptide (TPR) repeat protein